MKLSKGFFNAALPISFFLTIFANRFLPVQYFRDSTYINDRSKSAVTGFHDPFQIIVNLYNFCGITKYSLVPLVQWVIFAAVVVGIRRGVDKNDNFNNIISIYYLFLIPFFGSMMTKEILLGLLILISVLFNVAEMASNSHRLQIYCLIFFLIGISIRNYYFLTLLLMFLLFLIDRYFKKLLIVFLLLVVPFAATLDFKFGFISHFAGTNIFGTRNSIYNLLAIKPRTAISQITYSGNPISNIISYLRVVQQMFFPWQILAGSLYNFVTFAPIIFLTGVIGKVSYLIWCDKMLVAEFQAFLSYLIVATVFEPDLGSFLRHTFTLLPIVLIGINRRKFSIIE